MGIKVDFLQVCNIADWTKNWIWFLMNKEEDVVVLVAEFVIILLCIWNERNKVIFRENSTLSLQHVMAQIKDYKEKWHETYEMS